MIRFHVGAGKTGTSSLQRFFVDIAPQVRDRIKLPRTESPKILDHKRFADTVNDEAVREISELSRSRLPVVISSEDLHSLAMTKHGRQRLRELQRESGESEVLFAVRRQSDWIESAINEWAKNATLKQSPEKVAKHLASYPLTQQIETFREIWGFENVTVMVYEKELASANPSAWLQKVLSKLIIDFDYGPASHANYLNSNSYTLHPLLTSMATSLASESELGRNSISKILGRASELIEHEYLLPKNYFVGLSPEDLSRIEEGMTESYKKLADSLQIKGDLFISPPHHVGRLGPSEITNGIAQEALMGAASDLLDGRDSRSIRAILTKRSELSTNE